MTLRETLDAAERAANYYRRGTLAWPVLMQRLLDLGMYAIDRHAVIEPSERGIVAWYNGVRFEL